MRSERWLLALCLLLLGVGLIDGNLRKKDEARVVALGLEMSETGGVVVPRLFGEPFVEKPPLYYLATAGLIHALEPVLGVVRAARLGPLGFGLLTLLFVYLLARRMHGPDTALLATLILGSAYGFFRESHTIRVDVGLMAAVAGALWAIGEAYLAERRGFLPIAGVFAGLAFLVKGPVGVVLILTAWAGLMLPWLLARRARHNRAETRRWLLAHLGALLVMAAVMAAWIVPFKLSADPALWHEWLWGNQIGRISGNSALGHTGGGPRPLFYVLGLVSLMLPWSPLPFVWLAGRVRALHRERTLPPADGMLLAWGFASLALLTLAATKRTVYLLPALPAFALMSADVVRSGPARVWRAWFTGFMIVCALVQLLMLVTPALAAWTPDASTVRLLGRAFLPAYGPEHLVPAAGLAGSLFLLLRSRAALALRVVGVVLATYLGLLAASVDALHRGPGREQAAVALVERIPAAERPRVASIGLDDPSRRLLYIFGRQVFPEVEPARLEPILLGADPDYDSVLVELAPSVLGALNSPHRILAECELGNRSRERSDQPRIYWLEPMRDG